jgi:hypothetical protein
VLYCFVVVTTLVGISAAQSGPARYNLDFGPTGVFPLSGFRTFGDSAGPGWRGGSELLLIKHLGAEAGFTEGAGWHRYLRQIRVHIFPAQFKIAGLRHSRSGSGRGRPP